MAQLPGDARAKQAGGTGADDDNIKHFHAPIVARLLYGRRARGLGIEGQGAQTLAMRPSRVPLHCAKNKFNKVNRYKFEVIVNVSNLLANLLSERVDCKEGAPGFMEDLYLYEKTACGRPSHAARGLQLLQKLDVSTEYCRLNYFRRQSLTVTAQFNPLLGVAMSQYKFRVYNKRSESEITYTVTKTETEWHIQHIAINGDCSPDGSTHFYTNFEQDNINYPSGFDGFLEFIWSGLNNKEISSSDVQLKLLELANWVSICERTQPKCKGWNV